jgi:O-antigen/teichoic acid export membrane protein
MAPLTGPAKGDQTGPSTGDPSRPAKGDLKGLVKGSMAGLVGAGVSAGSQFLVVVAVTRGLDAQSAGTVFTATTLCLMVAGILRLDCGNGLIYFIARSQERTYHDISRYFRVALAPVITLSLATAAVVLAYGDTIATALVSGPAAAALSPALHALAVALPVIVCADVLLSATRGFGTMRPTALLGGVLQPGAQLLLVGTAASTGVAAGLAWVIPAAWAVPALPVLVLSAIWLRRRVPSGPYLPGTAREYWRHTAPRALGGAVQAVFQRLDIVIVAVLAGPAEAALYTAATRFKVVGQLVNQGLAQAVQPRLVRAMAEGDLPLARRLYQAATMWLVVLTWPVWLGYAALAPWLLGVFGEHYSDGATVAAVLAVTMMAATACGMVDVVLIAAGHTTSSMVNIIGAIAVTVALDVALVPAHGALGAALGWSGGVLVKNLLPLLQLARLYDLRPFGAHSLPSLHPWHTAVPRRSVHREAG